ncbi:MAG TPA: hypothetical protein VNI01_06165 [Elusimicrobiota bacterium]|nr:hypothetical protein [Elusimicrobiota bacterium]
MTSAALLAALLALPASAKTVRLAAYDNDGKPMDLARLIAFISPAQTRPAGNAAGLLLTDVDGVPVAGRPWWVERSSGPAWSWEGADKVRASFPWPIEKDGFSTVQVDAGGAGYADGQAILLNEEIALTAYRMLQESFKDRTTTWTPTYQPGRKGLELLAAAKDAIARAKAARPEPTQARAYNDALQAVSYAWQQMLFEHGRQIAEDPKLGPALRWGLTLDETVIDRVSEFDWLADRLQEARATWVRLVFRTNPLDFTYSEPKSFTIYDELLSRLAERKIRVMGSVLDSLLWPKGVTPELYAQRANNLAIHFKDRIRSWEVASEPNGTWIGGSREPLPDELVLDCVMAGASRLKKFDPTLETVATLHWWEGTAGDDRHPTFAWARWAKNRGFGKDLDVMALSLYPHRHPVGIAFDPMFSRLRVAFPGQKLMLGGFSFIEGKDFAGYWWLEPGSVDEARKDVLSLYTGAACAVPQTLGGGFWWPTLSQMFPPEKRTTALFRVYRNLRKRISR